MGVFFLNFQSDKTINGVFKKCFFAYTPEPELLFARSRSRPREKGAGAAKMGRLRNPGFQEPEPETSIGRSRSRIFPEPELKMKKIVGSGNPGTKTGCTTTGCTTTAYTTTGYTITDCTTACSDAACCGAACCNVGSQCDVAVQLPYCCLLWCSHIMLLTANTLQQSAPKQAAQHPLCHNRLPLHHNRQHHNSVTNFQIFLVSSRDF